MFEYLVIIGGFIYLFGLLLFIGPAFEDSMGNARQDWFYVGIVVLWPVSVPVLYALVRVDERRHHE